jgi:hypothetical protein
MYTESVADRSSIRALPPIFYSADHVEPEHVHVERDDTEAKFWLDPVRLERSRGFSPRELRRIEALVEKNSALLIEAWNEYFGN